MIKVTVNTNIAKVMKAWNSDIKRFEDAHNNFSKRILRRVETHAKAIVWKTVYQVYNPLVYDRTFNLYRSMRAYISSANPNEIIIDSDPDIAKMKGTKNVPPDGGYAKYVAGEGPGIGFLSQRQKFPRQFHYAILSTPSGTFKNIGEDIADLYTRTVLSKLR